jgi:ABC-2 type transport system permease protein
MWALYAREVRRFYTLIMDTVFSPIVSTGLYLAVFGIVLGGQSIEGVPYLLFVYTGLLTMMVVNSSFSNPGFALIIAKNLGSIVDLQLAPIAPWAVGIAYSCAALTRAVFTFAVAALCTMWFVPDFTIMHPLLFIFALVITGLEFGMLGVVFGMWAKDFSALTFITTFVLQPMIFLAGVFYPIAHLPAPWSTISMFNPLHHTINLFRYSMISYSDADPWISLVVISVFAIVLFGLMTYSTRKKLRS